MNTDYAWYGNDFIEKEDEKFTVNSEGAVGRTVGGVFTAGMDLIETTTLTEDTFTETGDEREVYYVIDIVGRYFIKFKVPRGTIQGNFADDTAFPKLLDDD